MLITSRLPVSIFMLCAFAMMGCSSAPAPVLPPEIEVEPTILAIQKLCDTNGDGMIAIDEAPPSPALQSRFEAVDSNGDKKLSAEELGIWLANLTADGAGVMRFGCRVTLDGRPLAGAAVRLDPEPYLADAVVPASGTANDNGQCRLSVDPNDMPEELSRVRGVQPGLYRVRITHGSAAIPAKYNSATTLGVEVSTSTVEPEGVTFALTSR